MCRNLVLGRDAFHRVQSDASDALNADAVERVPTWFVGEGKGSENSAIISELSEALNTSCVTKGCAHGRENPN